MDSYSRKNQEMMKIMREKETKKNQSIIIKYTSEASHRNKRFQTKSLRKKRAREKHLL